MSTNVVSQPMLIDVAFSHLDLALIHMQQQAPLLSSDDWVKLFRYADRLKQWASDAEQEQTSILQEQTSALKASQDAEHDVGDSYDRSCAPRFNVTMSQNRLVAALGDESREKSCVKEEETVILPPEEISEAKVAMALDEARWADVPNHPSAAQPKSVQTVAPLVVALSRSRSSHSASSDDRISYTGQETEFSTSLLRRRFMAIFDELDSNKQGTIDYAEFRRIFTYMNIPLGHASKVLRDYDIGKDGRKKTQERDGQIDRVEWLRMVNDFRKGSDRPEIHDFLQQLLDRYAKFGFIYKEERPAVCILPHDSMFRLIWDLFLMLLLLYIMLTLPMTFAFGDIFGWLDLIIDFLFCFDMVLNFRTTYLNGNREVVRQSRAIARHYVQTWFIVDLISSIPLELITSGVMPGLQVAKFMKFGKIAKVMNMLRLNKMFKTLQGSEMFCLIEELVFSKHCFSFFRVLGLIAQLCVCAHWLACILIALDGQALDYYLDGIGNPSSRQKYIAALYWSMMTMTTVGYGDVAMKTDAERVLAVLAMVFGASFYGYVVGALTSLVAQHDLNDRAYKDRMDLVMSWLDFHEELPKSLRRRIWRHFRNHLEKRTAVEDAVVLNDLPATLQQDVSHFLMHDDVRYNPLFEDFPKAELSQLVLSLERMTVPANDFVCVEGTAGTGMFFVIKGVAGVTQQGKEEKSHQLHAGESFGEEILLGLEQQFLYTVVGETKLEMLKFPLDVFRERFKNQPALTEMLMQNYENYEGVVSGPYGERSNCKGSILKGGTQHLSPDFPDAVFDAFHDLSHKIDVWLERYTYYTERDSTGDAQTAEQMPKKEHPEKIGCKNPLAFGLGKHPVHKVPRIVDRLAI